MRLYKCKPTSPSRRNLIKVKNLNLNPNPLLKNSMKGLKKNSGRNNSGKITVRHQGGGRKKKYRNIDFHRTENTTGVVMSIEYDPMRTAHIAAVYDNEKNLYFYILAPKNLEVGDIVKSGAIAESKLGHSLPISKIPSGTIIHNLTTNIKKGGQFCRSAGTFAQVMEKTNSYARVILNSGEHRIVDTNCYASIGIVSNDLWVLTTKGKAGRSRWLNKRPTVRGVAMNPVDHPHGGGEGKKSGCGKTPWGKPTKTGPTSKSRNKYIFKKR